MKSNTCYAIILVLCWIGITGPVCAQLTPIATHTPQPTNTFTPTKTFTATKTHTNTKTFTPTATHTRTKTFTATSTATNTSTSTATNTPTSTPTNTKTSTATNTPTATTTNTPTDTPTSTPTDTPAASFTNTFTHTFTVTATYTNTPTNTRTPIKSFTHTPVSVKQASTWGVYVINTPTPTITPTPTGTVSWGGTATPTNTSTFGAGMVAVTTPGAGYVMPIGAVNSNGTYRGVQLSGDGKIPVIGYTASNNPINDRVPLAIIGTPIPGARDLVVRSILETTDGVSNTTVSASNPLPVTLAYEAQVRSAVNAVTQTNSQTVAAGATTSSKAGRDGIAFFKSGVCGPRESASHVYAEALGTTPVTLKAGGDNLYHDLCQLILTNQGTGDGELYIYNGPVTHCGVYMTGVDANHASINMVLPEAESLTKTAGWTAVAAAGMTVHISARFNDHP